MILCTAITGTRRKDALIAGMVAASCAARLASTAASLSIERKWVKLLCKSEDDQRMAVINSGTGAFAAAVSALQHGRCFTLMTATSSVSKQLQRMPDWFHVLVHVPFAAMRRIDLLCLLAAPIASGFCMTYLSLRAATAALAAWNAATWAPSVLLLCHAGKTLPPSRVCSRGAVGLLLPPEHEDEVFDSIDTTPDDDDGIGVPAAAPLVPVDDDDEEDCEAPVGTRSGCMFYRLCYGPARGLCKGFGLARTYWQQPVAFPAFALAMLYFSVMSLGLIMTSYLKCVLQRISDGAA